MQNLILSLEGQFPQIYSQSKLLNSSNSTSLNNASTSHSNSHSSSASNISATTSSTVTATSNPTTTSDEILPNKLPLKRRLSEFRFGRDGGTLTVGKKGSNNMTSFTTNPFAFDKFKDITTAFTVHLHDDGVLLDPGAIGPFPYSHPLILQLLNAINNGILPMELFITLFEQSFVLPPQQQLFYDGCVVVGVVEWREDRILTIGNVATTTARQHLNVQWTRRVNSAAPQSTPLGTQCTPESHKVLLKPTSDCWEYALAFMATLPDGAKYARIMEDEDKLLEFERQLTLINEPIVCLDPSPMVMYAMNALYFDHFKHRLFSPLTAQSDEDSAVFDELDSTLMNLAALKPTRTDSTVLPAATVSSANGPASPTSNPRYRKISLIESWQDRERRRTTEPIYGIDHRRQFVKNRQPLPPSSFVPANWRPFKTIRYEREISSGVASHVGSLAKLYYCVNVFYAPPPTFPPIQLLLQVGTAPDSSSSGFLHHLHFSNLIETENYLQNLRNLLLIENGNCNLKVITDISTTSAAGVGPSTTSSAASNAAAMNSAAVPGGMRKPPTVPMQSPPATTQPAQSQYQLTPHQILQLNQQRSSSNPSINPTNNPVNPTTINKPSTTNKPSTF